MWPPSTDCARTGAAFESPLYHAVVDGHVTFVQQLLTRAMDLNFAWKSADRRLTARQALQQLDIGGGNRELEKAFAAADDVRFRSRVALHDALSDALDGVSVLMTLVASYLMRL